MNGLRAIVSAHALRDESGVTLLELVVASAILLVSVLGVLTALTFAATANSQTAIRARALNLANQRLEAARNLPYDNVGVRHADGTFGDPAGSIPALATQDEFTVATEVSWAIDPSTGRSEYKNIKITVSWERPRPGTTSLSSAIFGKSDLVNIGDLKVTVQDRDTGAVITGAIVRVTPAGGGAQRLVWSNSSGISFFGALPIGVTPVDVSATGWVFEAITTTTIVPDLLTMQVAYGHLPCSIGVSVVDTAGVPVANPTISLTSVANGQVQLQAPPGGTCTFSQLLPGAYAVRVTCSGYYSSLSYPINVGSPNPRDGSQTVPIQPIQPPGTVRVLAKDGNGVALSGVTVHATGPSPLTADVAGSPQQTTPALGEADFANLVSGTYAVTGTKTGYTTGTGTAVVLSGLTTTVNLSLPLAGPTTGSLYIKCPARAYVNIVGPTYPSGTRQRVARTTYDMTLPNLIPGYYSVTPEPRSGFNPVVPASQTPQVIAGQTAQAAW